MGKRVCHKISGESVWFVLATEWREIVAHGDNRGIDVAKRFKPRPGRKRWGFERWFSVAPAGARKICGRLNP